jgi:hypothetical protein
MRKSWIAASLAGLMACAGSAAYASPVYSASFQGATFDITQTGASTLTFEILSPTGLSGDWMGAGYLGAFDLKGLGVDFSAPGVSATAKYMPAGGPTILGIQAQLNSNTCNTGVGETASVCFNASPNIAYAHDMLFDITISGAALSFAATGPHLQTLWSSSSTDDNKVGSLYFPGPPAQPG